ncbi:MAG: hypothetical protein U5J78_05085 [Parasphingorhabdus sp.]|nr:hypothetical protein [Parasphingorhabdus sp.]
MGELITSYWLFFLIALLIGIGTAWWIWGYRDATTDNYAEIDEPVAPEADPPRIARPERPAMLRTGDLPPATRVPAAPSLAEPVDRIAVERVKVARAIPPVASPLPQTPPPPPPGAKPAIAAAIGEPDNLLLIKGIGPKLNILLNDLGVSRFDQIAAWREAEIAEVDRFLDSFQGRITRDAWIDQAKFLARDDIAGFEAKYGKL